MLLYDEDGEQRTVFAFAYGETVHQMAAGGDNVAVEETNRIGNFEVHDPAKGQRHNKRSE